LIPVVVCDLTFDLEALLHTLHQVLMLMRFFLGLLSRSLDPVDRKVKSVLEIAIGGQRIESLTSAITTVHSIKMINNVEMI